VILGSETISLTPSNQFTGIFSNFDESLLISLFHDSVESYVMRYRGCADVRMRDHKFPPKGFCADLFTTRHNLEFPVIKDSRHTDLQLKGS
jgi:hypothetical protein